METSGDNGIDFRHPELWDEPDYIRKEMARAMGHIYRHGMTTTSGGNMSVTDSLGNTWITPSGTDKGSLKPDEIVCVAPDGTWAGPLRPSMEYPLHRGVYAVRPDLRALIHAHPPVLTSFSIVNRIPDTSVVRVWRETCGTVGYAGYAVPGSDSMGEKVAREFIKGHNAVIMENHAVVVGGRDLAEAQARLETLENCARTIHAAGFLGEPVITENASGDNPEFSSGNYPPKPGRDLLPGVTDSEMSRDEELLAEEICRTAVRACRRELMYGFCGTVSARSTGDSFLITTGKVLRCNIGGGDITAGRCGETHSFPGERLHAEIYQRFPAVRAVIDARPPYLMAFAVSGKEVNVRTIPESWILLQEMPLVPFGELSPGREEIFGKLSAGIPAVLIANDSVLVTGDSLLQAFDRLEVAEMTAMSLVLGKSLGSVNPISDNNITELRRAFFSD